jgi:tRNA(Ile)-lysidine synthase
MGLLTSDGPVSVNIPIPDEFGEKGKIAVKIPHTDLYIYIYLFENKGDLEYNNFSWFCPIELARDGNLALVNLSANPTNRVFKKAGAVGSKKVTRLFTDLKIPESAREGILFAARKNEDKILWIPGVGHAEGFTSPLSRERFGQHGATKAEGILKITLERRQDGN